jgi:hypothetical protein
MSRLSPILDRATTIQSSYDKGRHRQLPITVSDGVRIDLALEAVKE